MHIDACTIKMTDIKIIYIGLWSGQLSWYGKFAIGLMTSGILVWFLAELWDLAFVQRAHTASAGSLGLRQWGMKLTACFCHVLKLRMWATIHPLHGMNKA